MNLIRWDPFRDFEGIQTRFEGNFANWSPAVDIQETEKEYLVKADLPDVRKEDVKVELDEGILTVEGERNQEKEETGKKFHKVERTYGRFVRRFILPTEIDDGHVKAEFKDGVLNIHLPKTAVAKPKTVEVTIS